MAARWRIFRHSIRVDVENITLIVQACLALHDYLQLTTKSSYTPRGFIDEELSDGSIKEGGWRRIVQGSAIRNVPRLRGRRRRTMGNIYKCN